MQSPKLAGTLRVAAPLLAILVLSCMLASPALAADFQHSSSTNGPSVVVTSTLINGSPGTYQRTVTVMLANGAQASQSDVRSYSMNSAVTGNFNFGGNVIGVLSIIALPDMDP